jgi:hypothetical protein
MLGRLVNCWIEMDVERRGHDIYLDGLRITTNNLSQDSRGPFEVRAGVLAIKNRSHTIHPTYVLAICDAVT